jgi:hypothetical protein
MRIMTLIFDELRSMDEVSEELLNKMMNQYMGIIFKIYNLEPIVA